MNELRARRIVSGRSGGWCERCDRRLAAEWHHRKNRSQGGRWCPSNGLDLCGPCHRFVTAFRTVAFRHGWAVEEGLDPRRVPVWLARRGLCLLSPAGDVTPVFGRELSSWHVPTHPADRSP